jgi:hypothetical protein
MQRLKTTLKVTKSIKVSVTGRMKFKFFHISCGLFMSQQIINVS